LLVELLVVHLSMPDEHLQFEQLKRVEQVEWEKLVEPAPN